MVTKSHSQNVTSAMGLMTIAMLFVPGMDAIAKWLSTHHSLSPATITFVRFSTQTVFMYSACVFATGSLLVKSSAVRFNILRGMLMGAAAMLFFTSVKYMPIADAISVFFVEPILVMFLSWLLLGESVGWRRVIAAIVGFSGAVLVIQPSFDQFGIVSLLPLCTAFLFALYLILTRRFGVNDNPMAMQFYAGIGGALFCGLALLTGELSGVENISPTIPATWVAVGWMVLIGALGSFCHFLIVLAFSKTQASILAPFQYIEIVSATLLGLIIFDDFPDALKWLGIAIIICSGLYIFWREQQVSRA